LHSGIRVTSVLSPKVRPFIIAAAAPLAARFPLPART
jgi:hypothetical protein